MVISLLIDAAAIDAVYLGPQGLLCRRREGQAVHRDEHGDAGGAGRAGRKVRAKGAAFVECPVSGSVIPARAGKLLGLMGAEAADVGAGAAVARTDVPAGDARRAGRLGALLKLAVNLPLMIYWQALGEQLASVQARSTIDPAELLDFLAETSGAATVLKQRMPGIVAKLKKRSRRASQPSASTAASGRQSRCWRKASAGGFDLPLLQQTLACYEEAQAQCRRRRKRCPTFRPMAGRKPTNHRGGRVDEAVFVLAVARDLSRAHCDEPEGPQA